MLIIFVALYNFNTKFMSHNDIVPLGVPVISVLSDRLSNLIRNMNYHWMDFIATNCFTYRVQNPTSATKKFIEILLNVLQCRIFLLTKSTLCSLPLFHHHLRQQTVLYCTSYLRPLLVGCVPVDVREYHHVIYLSEGSAIKLRQKSHTHHVS